MKKYSKLLLIAVFVTLIAGSVQSVTANHSEPDVGYFLNPKPDHYENLIDSKYTVYVQVEHRNENGQLISITDSSAFTGQYLSNNFTDHMFDTLMGKKEIITIDNIKYEKAQYTYSPDHYQALFGLYPIFVRAQLNMDPGSGTHERLHEGFREYSNWKNLYCATLEGYGVDCLVIFKVTAPTMTLEPHDSATQHWTILRMLN